MWSIRTNKLSIRPKVVVLINLWKSANKLLLLLMKQPISQVKIISANGVEKKILVECMMFKRAMERIGIDFAIKNARMNFSKNSSSDLLRVKMKFSLKSVVRSQLKNYQINLKQKLLTD